MTQYKFVPNNFVRHAFNDMSARAYYTGDSVDEVLEAALGKKHYDRHMFAQDFFVDGETSSRVDIILNPEEKNRHLVAFKPIGTIYKLG